MVQGWGEHQFLLRLSKPRPDCSRLSLAESTFSTNRTVGAHLQIQIRIPLAHPQAAEVQPRLRRWREVCQQVAAVWKRRANSLLGSTPQVDLRVIVNYEVAIAFANVLPHLTAPFDPGAVAVRFGLEPL
jgi:hypothetical protein